MFSGNAFAVSNAWIPKWFDGPATATYERTPTTLKTYVNVPSSGGHAEWTLNSNPTKSWASGNSSGTVPSFGPASTATTPKISTNVKIPIGVGLGTAAAATLTAVIPKAALAKAATAMVRANPYITTAITLGWLANAGYQYLSNSDTFTQLPPLATPLLYNWNSMSGTPSSYSSPELSCGDPGRLSNYGMPGGSFASATRVNDATYSCMGYTSDHRGPFTAGYASALANSQHCNTGYDYVNGSCQRQAGAQGVPVTPASVETGIASVPVSGTADTAGDFDNEISELVKAGYNPDLDTATVPQLTGPATQIQGQKQTQTTPSGDVITTNTIYNNTYTDNYISTSQTTTTTTTPASGTPTTTTVTGPAQTESPVKDQLTDCEKYPLSIGCSTYGAVPTAETIPVTILPATMSYTTWGAGSCPNPVNTVHGIVFDYQPMCDKLLQIKPIMIGTAMLLALFIVSAAVKD